MKRLHAAGVLILLIVMCQMPIIFAQEVGRPESRYDEQNRMVSIFGMFDSNSLSGCSRFVFTGTITAVEYDDERRIVNFYLKSRNGRRSKIYLPGELFERGLSKAATKRLPTLITKGKRVRVIAYGCGVSAAVLEADEITAL